MITENGAEILCNQTQCGERIKNNMWASIKAHDEGWFFSRDGSAYCPLHVPDWVLSWRKRKKDDGK